MAKARIDEMRARAKAVRRSNRSDGQGTPSLSTPHCRVLAESLRPYDIVMVENLFDAGAPVLSQMMSGRCGLIVTTPTVASLYLDKFMSSLRTGGREFPVLVLHCTERQKTIEQVMTVCEKSVEAKIDRQGVIVGLGGGVCTDIATVAASWIRRGIHHVRVPTTLVGQVDAAIGIKGSVNFHGRKNYLGCFYPPRLVVVDPQFLRSLPPVHIRSGLAEILKISVVSDARLFELIETHADALLSSGFAGPLARDVVRVSILRMVEELQHNIYEDRGYERLVDFGHTFSPSLESASQFSVPHGEAVAIDMAVSCMISAELGFIRESEAIRIVRLIRRIGLSIYSPLLTQRFCEHAIEDAALHRAGMLNLVLPTCAGGAKFVQRKQQVHSAMLAHAIGKLRDLDTDVARGRPAALEDAPRDAGEFNLSPTGDGRM
jgi:2-epi-5-epi-valiolone synthase